MKNLADDITDLRTFQELSKKFGKISTIWHPANSDLATGHCFKNRILADKHMLLLESILRHDYTLDQRLIVYIDLHAKHPKLVGQCFELFTCNTTTYHFTSEQGSFYSVLELAVQADESTVNVNEDTRVRYPSQLITSVTRVEKNLIRTGSPSGFGILGGN